MVASPISTSAPPGSTDASTTMWQLPGARQGVGVHGRESAAASSGWIRTVAGSVAAVGGEGPGHRVAAGMRRQRQLSPDKGLHEFEGERRHRVLELVPALREGEHSSVAGLRRGRRAPVPGARGPACLRRRLGPRGLLPGGVAGLEASIVLGVRSAGFGFAGRART